MKLIRWLLSNSILIVFFLVIAYGFVYWGHLTDEDTPAGPIIARLSGEYDFVRNLVAKYEEFKAPQGETVAGTTTAESVAEPVKELTSGDAVAPLAVSEQESTQDKYVTPEIVQSLTRVAPPPAEVPATASSTEPAAELVEEEPATTRDLWISARKAFHRREYEKSIRQYEKLIATTEDNYDAYGELGNVYFNQGKIKQAAASYYDAAAVLVRLGQIDRAASLVGLMGRMDVEKARELQDLIASARS